MTWYPLLKTVHIVSSTVLFGTGLGIAFFKWAVDRAGNVAAIRAVSERVVVADWLFTAPAIAVQAVTGIALARLLGYPLTTMWIAWAIVLYCFAGACWIPVVVLQIRMRDLALVAEREQSSLPPQYWSYARTWFWLGVLAFCAVLAVFGLMTFKPQA